MTAKIVFSSLLVSSSRTAERAAGTLPFDIGVVVRFWGIEARSIMHFGDQQK